MAEKNKNWWERATATLEDVEKTYNRGVNKGLEGVIDAGIGAVGAVGGIFSDDFKRTMQKAIQFDLTGYLTEDTRIMDWMQAVGGNPRAIKELITGDKTLEETRKDSFLSGNKVGEFMQEGVESIGHMMPGLALSLIPGVGPALSMGYTGLSAGGGAMEEALNDGAGYYNALAYGALSGGTEALMEKLGGYAFGDATSLVGKATAGTKFGAWASKGVGKAVTGAVSEGVEELGSGFADPVNKWVTGVDTEIGANFRKALQEAPRTFAMGAAVGSVMQGGQVAMQTMSNKASGRGGAKATRADSVLSYVSESAQNYGKNEALNKKTDKAVLQGLTDIGVQMTQMSESERAKYRESLGEYKNAFNEDGSIKLDLVNADVNAGAISRKLQPISATLKHAPINANEQISQGASQAKSHIEKVLGGKANVVITNSDSGTNAFFNPDENVFYINNKSATLNDADGAIKKASLQISFHEMTHSAEGTRQYNEFVNELYRVAIDENAPDSVKKRIGSLGARARAAIEDYAEQTKEMSKAQARYTVDTEIIADLSGDLMADDYIVNKLAERNAPLVKKLISRFKGTIKKSATVDSESIKYLKKLVNRFEKALDNAQGGVKISQIGNDDEEKEGKVDDERYSKVGADGNFSEAEIKKIKEKISNTVDIAISNNGNLNEEYNQKVLSEVHGDLANMVEVATEGMIDISKKRIALHGGYLWHAYKRHVHSKDEQARHQIPFSLEQFKEAIEAIYSPDLVECVFNTINNPIEQRSFAYAKKSSNGYYVVVEVIGGKRNPNIVPVMVLQFDETKWNSMIAEGKTLGELFYENDADMSQCLDVEFNKKNRVTAAQFASSEAIANTLRSPRFNNSIHDNSQKNNTFDENNSKNISDERKSVKRSYEVDSTGETLSEAQADYFKDSKVRDENGNLLVVYHGTEATFNIYKSNSGYEEYFFTDNYDAAVDYGSKVKKQYLNITNPYTVDFKGRYDKEIFDAIDYAKENGFDGVIALNTFDGANTHNQYVAFSKNQIKNTDNKSPTKNPDIRYSKQRSYEPGKESEFEEVLKSKYESTSTDLSKYKKEKSSKPAEKTFSQDEMLSLSMKLLEVTSDRDKSNKKIVELTKALNQAKGDLKRYEKTITSLADELNSKKYSSNDVAMAMEALLSVDSPLGRSIELKDSDYEAAIRKLKNDLNSKTDFNSKANAALELAKFIVKKGMITEYTVDSNMQEAIEFIDVLKPLLENESISAEDAIAKLDELGFDTSGFTSENVFEAIKTMYDDAYAIVADNVVSYRSSIYNTLNAKEAHQLTQKIAKEILASYEKFGEKTKLSEIVKKNTDKINGLKEDLKTAYERNKFENRILREISKMAEIQSGKYVNSTQAKPEVFSALQSLLKKLDSRGQLNRTSTRKILAKLAEWYIPENPMLKSFGAEGSENKNTGFFSQEMYEKIQYFVEDKGKERLSITELKEVNEILHHINHIFENYGKIWRGNRYVEALDVAKEYAKILNIAEKDVPAFARLLFKNAITKNLNDPMSVCASWDGHDENGFFTQTYREFAEALIKQKHDEMTALAELAEFEKKNKKYFKALINGKSKVKVTGRINVREGKIDTVEMPKYAAIDIYMTSRTGNAIDTFEQTGYTLKLDGQHIEDDFQTISREQIEAMYNDFTEQDKELIKILDKAYNGICRDLKYDCDMRRLGWSNVFEGIYYPLYRAHSVDFDKDDFKSVMSRVSNVSSNHTRVYSKNAIVVSNAITKFMRHVNDVTRYANLAIPVENLNILYNLDTGDNARMPTSIKTRLTKSDFWKGAKEYLFDLTNDVQGVGKELSSGNKAIAWLRGSYAKYQLGANPKVWFSQLSSYFASFGELRIGSLLKAFSLKDTYTNSDVDEYCKLAAVRSYERGASSAMAVSEKIGQAGSLLTKPIEFVDRRVVCALFSACQFEAKTRYGLEVGTKANKIKAGEILTDVILKTQQNQLVTEQSKVMREKSEIIKSFTMFSADQMKLNSRFCQTLSELATLNKKLKDAKKANDQQLINELTKKRNGAIKKLAKYSSSIITIAFYMAALAKAVQAFRRKDEDEPIGEWLFKEAGLNLLTTVPFFRDVVSFFTDGFEADIFAISMVNDVLNATDEMKNNFADMANGKEVTSEQWFATGRKAAYAIGQMAGFPIRNIYNVVTGWTRRISERAGMSIDAIFKEPSDTDLKSTYKEASEKGNASLADKSLDMIYKNHDMDLSDTVLKKELDRLNGLDITKKDDDKSNYSVIAKRVPDTITFEGEEVELTAKQKSAFKTGYKSAETDAGKMVRVYKYKKLDSASQAYAIRKIYEYHYSKSEESITGERERLVYFGDIIGIDKLALIIGYANSLKGDKDRKAKIEAYIKGMGMISQHASLALRYLGYSDKANDSKVKNFVNTRSSLTREQKEELLKYLSLDKESEEKKKAEEKEREREKEKERKKKEAQKQLENMLKLN